MDSILQGKDNNKSPNKVEMDHENNVTWNVETVYMFLETLNSVETNTRMIGTKTATLLAIETYCRPRSDLTRIPLRLIKCNNNIEGKAVIHIQVIKPKEGLRKNLIIKENPKPARCTARAIKTYTIPPKNYSNDLFCD
jgi:hypothetical protein